MQVSELSRVTCQVKIEVKLIKDKNTSLSKDKAQSRPEEDQTYQRHAGDEKMF